MEGKGNMERLTIEYCGEYVPKDMCSIDRLGGADDCDLCCEYCKATEDGNEDCRGCAINQCFNKLGEYETLEEQGKLLKLPCAVGDKIYLPNEYVGKVIDFEIIEICVFKEEIMFIDDSENEYFISDFGKSVFLTKEEAEAALKELCNTQLGADDGWPEEVPLIGVEMLD